MSNCTLLKPWVHGVVLDYIENYYLPLWKSRPVTNNDNRNTNIAAAGFSNNV